VNLAAGTTDGHPGLLALTDRRLLFLPKDHPASASIEIALAALSRVEVGPTDLLGSLTVVHARETRTFEVPDRALQEMGDFLRARVPSNGPEPG
jgi:hypothetical protein